MIERITIISGPVASGKSELANRLSARFGAPVIKTRDLIARAQTRRRELGRQALQRAGDRLDRQTDGGWIASAVSTSLMNEHADERHIIIDSIRVESQALAIRKAFGSIVTHIHVTAPLEVLQARYDLGTQAQGGNRPDYATVRKSATERKVEHLARVADVVIDSDRCTAADVAVRAEAALSKAGHRRDGYVDVLIGGQYGSEGKGQIVSVIAREYDLLVRVGGPNAGHKVFEEPTPFTHHLLPSGTRTSSAALLIGPGAVLRLQTLMEEISACGVDAERLGIDGSALIIEDADIEGEGGLVSGIGSTGQGVGAATARRITGRDPDRMPRRAKGIPELEPYICDAVQRVADAIEAGQRVLLEGTQGTGLSLYHGEYPFVTSRDTTVAACLSEAGIAPASLRKVIMVCRTYPIRVQSPTGRTSGSMSKEINFDIIAARSGKDAEALRDAERTSTTNRERRVGEFDWGLLRRAVLLNRPTDIALTFTDYIHNENEHAMRFDQLTEDTIQFIEELETVCEAPVSLIATGFNNRSIIDRRRW